MNGNSHFENCQVKVKAEVKEFFSSTLTSTSLKLELQEMNFPVTIQFLEKTIMQFMSHSPVRCPSATSLRLIRS